MELVDRKILEQFTLFLPECVQAEAGSEGPWRSLHLSTGTDSCLKAVQSRGPSMSGTFPTRCTVLGAGDTHI